ncbi:hypothetical protein [Pedobacter sp. BMA]|uniref:hypothetical protein n=1 Tax=Pedobacter sp. BMA TaxID=1663685 RepID=UPI00064974C7|nr:hypothetical protein [Pedobacter sp. BMA]KLT65925.1 hypothetical protein AB669_07000 [Pedobacter sp. BMA]
MYKKITYLIVCLFAIASINQSAKALPTLSVQDTILRYVPGQRYIFKVSDSSGAYATAIEYIPGDSKSKLILTSPHGGNLKPEFIRTRTKDYVATQDEKDYGDTESFSAVSDSKTLELTMELADEIKRLTGLRPHVVLNHLHRSKLDANRGMSLAAQGDRNAELAWKAFHQYIDAARVLVLKNGEGLLLDIHGNAHRPQRTEVGLLLKAKDFLSDNLEQYADQSSVKALVKGGKATMTDLVKGKYALGTLLSDEQILAVPGRSIPNPTDKTVFPDGKYFNGGYNTARHGSKFGGLLSAIQLEFNSDVRMDDRKRPEYVKHIAKAIHQFMDKYYN